MEEFKRWLLARDETCFALRLDLAREKKLREEAEERHEKEVADEIIRIADAIDQERKNRLDGEEAILRKLNDEVAALTEQITQEQVRSPLPPALRDRNPFPDTVQSTSLRSTLFPVCELWQQLPDPSLRCHSRPARNWRLRL